MSTKKRYGSKRNTKNFKGSGGSAKPAPKEMVEGYIDAALFSSNILDDEGNDEGSFESLNFDASDLTPEARKKIEEDCASFFNEEDVQDALEEEGSYDDERLGRDFWFTRNRHGAGFWDGDWKDAVGKTLTKAAHAYGEQNLYLDAEEDDDGEIIGGDVGVAD